MQNNISNKEFQQIYSFFSLEVTLKFNILAEFLKINRQHKNYIALSKAFEKLFSMLRKKLF